MEASNSGKTLKNCIVLHSGGMDSSICLYLAIKKFGPDQVISLGFDYGQRHSSELQAARTIADLFGVCRIVINMPQLCGWEDSSLLSKEIPIEQGASLPNSFVPARNGLFILMAAPLAKKLEASFLYLGVMELDGENSGYPDCKRSYIEAVQTVVRLDIDNPNFLLETPLIQMTKKETMFLAQDLGILDLLLHHTVTCYEGIPGQGCKKCPACRLRAEGLCQFKALNSQVYE